MHFRLLTYNIHKAIGVDRRFEPDRIVEILRHHEADVLLLQEVDRGVPRSRHLDLAHHLARRLQYEYRAVGMNVYLRKGQYGNATLSRYPIGRQRNIDLTIGRRKPRGAQHTRITVPIASGHGVEVFNIHLSLTARLRRQQVRRLLATGDVARIDPETPCIIGGDTNDWRGALRRPFFEQAGFQCATNRRPGSRGAIKTFPSFAPTGGLDKVFFRGALTLRRVHRSRLKLARVASDHLPVICEFEIEARAR